MVTGRVLLRSQLLNTMMPLQLRHKVPSERGSTNAAEAHMTTGFTGDLAVEETPPLWQNQRP